MKTLLTTYSTIGLVLLVLVFFALAWLFPSESVMIGVIFLSLSLLIAGSVVFQKHKELYMQGKSTRMFLRNVVLECTGIVLIMLLAGLLGRYIAGMVMMQFTNNMTRLVAGILIGASTGVLVSVLIRQIWGLRVLQKLHLDHWLFK